MIIVQNNLQRLAVIFVCIFLHCKDAFMFNSACSGLKLWRSGRLCNKVVSCSTHLRSISSDQEQLLQDSKANGAAGAKAHHRDSMVSKRTNECLDFSLLLSYLSDQVVTKKGKEMATTVRYHSSADINRAYAMMDELSGQIPILPLRTELDVWSVLKMIEQNSALPDREMLAAFAANIEELAELHQFVKGHRSTLTLFGQIEKALNLPVDLIEGLRDAFVADNQLNPQKFPKIGELTAQINQLKRQIAATLTSVMNSPAMKDKIADNDFCEIDGRFCITLRNTHKKRFGIVHATSSTGKTVYVEPFEVVDTTNELKDQQGALRAEENKILVDMCRLIAQFREEIKSAALAATEVDIMRARYKLGEILHAVIPEVGNNGQIRCISARHPLLVLKTVHQGQKPHKIVGNSFSFSDSSLALVISGPNAGGKTVVLKTCGLLALMVRYAIPVPATSGARVDFFSEVMADIGDMQSVTSDLSTFSGHLVICRDILETVKKAASSTTQKYCLALLDEVGTGTDPAQGTALAQAVLETLVGYGTRVMTTTHYSRIKDLAVHDKRFRIAAMEFIDNKPTYRLREGSVGESYALELAQRMKLPAALLNRAHVLLDDETRRLIALQQRLEEETVLARKLQMQLQAELQTAKDGNQRLSKQQQELDAEIQRVRDGFIQSYLVDLKEKEKQLEMMVLKVGDALSKRKQKGREEIREDGAADAPSVEGLLEDAKSFMKTERAETEKHIIAKISRDLGVEPLAASDVVEVGSKVVVLEPGALFGSEGMVVQRSRGKSRVHVNIAGIEIKVDRHWLGRSRLFSLSNKSLSPEVVDALPARDKKLLKMVQEEMPLGAGSLSRKVSSKVAMVPRTASNTLDIKYVTNLSDAQLATMLCFEAAARQAYDHIEEAENGKIHIQATSTLYILHGAQVPWKSKFRTWLEEISVVRKWQVADLSQGGEAATVVQLDFDI